MENIMESPSKTRNETTIWPSNPITGHIPWKKEESEVVSDSLWLHRLGPARLLHSCDFTGKNTGVGCHFLLQGIIPTRGSNSSLPHWRQTPYHLSHNSNPIQNDKYTPVFIAALFTIAIIWKQPWFLSIDKWIKKIWDIYIMDCCSSIRRNKFESVIVRWMNLEPLKQSEVNQREKNIVY